MLNKRITVSCILAIALAFSGCGGGGNTTSDVGEKGDTTKDTTAPVFAGNSIFTKSVEEGSGVDIATYTVSDDSPVTFTLGGEDAEDFTLNSKVIDSGYQAILKLKTVPDYERQASYHVTLTATDESNNSTSKDITVNVIDKPFTFDVAGNMGTVVAGGTKTLPLVTKEAKSNVTYQVIAGANFAVNGNQVVFTAPAYVDGGNNTYVGIVRASDGISDDIELTVKANVIKDANAKPDIKNFLLKSRKDIEPTEGFPTYTEYAYTYVNGYLDETNVQGTDIDSAKESTVYEYSADHSIMKEYRKFDHKLKSIRVFEDKKTDKTKFAANINLRLSVDPYTDYMSYIEDIPALKNNRHLTKYIHGLEYGQRSVELYAYNNNDQLTRVIHAYAESVPAATISAMSDAQLHTKIAPSGGFPSGDVKLSSTQINSAVLPVTVEYETTYVYDQSGKLTARKLFDYGADKTKSDPVTISYYANKVIKSIKSDGVDIEYNTDSLLNNVNNYDYSYAVSGSQTTVDVIHNGKTVTTYIFEEE